MQKQDSWQGEPQPRPAPGPSWFGLYLIAPIEPITYGASEKTEETMPRHDFNISELEQLQMNHTKKMKII